MNDGVLVRRLTRRFGADTVLDALDLELNPGEFVALLGRSGSGKTTLLRTLAGLDPAPAEATIVVPQPTAVVFQEPRLLPWKRVWRNVAIGLRGVAPHASAEAALREVELTPRSDAWPLTLSGGEAQRAALDALTRIRMHGLIVELWRAHAPTTLLVTHDVDEAVLLADRALVLRDGRVAADLPIDLPRPRSHAHPHFSGLRTRLLSELGVEVAPAAPVLRLVSMRST